MSRQHVSVRVVHRFKYPRPPRPVRPTPHLAPQRSIRALIDPDTLSIAHLAPAQGWRGELVRGLLRFAYWVTGV